MILSFRIFCTFYANLGMNMIDISLQQIIMKNN